MPEQWNIENSCFFTIDNEPAITDPQVYYSGSEKLTVLVPPAVSSADLDQCSFVKTITYSVDQGQDEFNESYLEIDPDSEITLETPITVSSAQIGIEINIQMEG